MFGGHKKLYLLKFLLNFILLFLLILLASELIY